MFVCLLQAFFHECCQSLKQVNVENRVSKSTLFYWSFLDVRRLRSELDAWKERSRRNIDHVEDQTAALQESQRGVKYAEEKLYAKTREIREKDVIIEEQAAEIGKLRVNLTESKVF